MMTIDEAIKHCLEVAEQNEAKAQKIGVQFLGTIKDREATECRECAADHRQLAEWLRELKELRNSVGAVKLKDMKEAVKLLSELDEENTQLIQQLVEAKRLLRLAVEDFDDMHRHIWDCTDCKSCPLNKGELGICGQEWRYADEAEKLLGDEI